MDNIKELMQNIRKRPVDDVLLRYVDDEGVHKVMQEVFVSDVDRYMRGLYRHFEGKTG